MQFKKRIDIGLVSSRAAAAAVAAAPAAPLATTTALAAYQNKNNHNQASCYPSSYSLSSKHNKINPRKMNKKVHIISDHRYQSILSSRSVPFLFIIICFLIIANTRCDQVGSTNDDSKASLEEKTTTQTKANTYDPLNMLREIYLDHNSKVITMILPSNGDPVQKFHPNGRYGRRSVNNFVEPHAELGKLRMNDDIGSLRSILRGINKQSNINNGNDKIKTVNVPELSKIIDEQSSRTTSLTDDNDSMINPMELSKLLRCNYSGISNLYWCDNGL